MPDYLAVFTSDKTGPKWAEWYALSEAEKAERDRIGLAALLSGGERREPFLRRTGRGQDAEDRRTAPRQFENHGQTDTIDIRCSLFSETSRPAACLSGRIMRNQDGVS